MKKKNKTFEEIYDLTAVRIIVDTVKDCYAVLGMVHTMWIPMPGRLKIILLCQTKSLSISSYNGNWS